MKRLYLKQQLLSLLFLFWARKVQANISFQLSPGLKVLKGETIWLFHNKVAWYKGKPLFADGMARVLTAIVAGWLSKTPKSIEAPRSCYTDPKSDTYYPLVLVPGTEAPKPEKIRISRPAYELDEELKQWFSHHFYGDRE